jgi:hypothetical protein
MTERMNSFKDEVEELNRESMPYRSQHKVLYGFATLLFGIIVGLLAAVIIEMLV